MEVSLITPLISLSLRLVRFEILTQTLLLKIKDSEAHTLWVICILENRESSDTFFPRMTSLQLERLNLSRALRVKVSILAICALIFVSWQAR